MKITTLVLPGSEKTFTIPSIDNITPERILNSPTINHPEKIPINSETITCLVRIANDIAIRGGTKDRNP